MELFGVINASPDSLHTDSIVTSADEAAQRADWLLENGAFGFDVGGQGSTFAAGESTVEEEWARLEAVLPRLLSYDVPVSVDTWRPETARRSLELGVPWLNAADGLQQPEMMELVAEHRCPVVLPFLSGPDPLRMEVVAETDPVDVILRFFEDRLAEADRFGIRDLVAVDPGTGFAPHEWPWEQRFVYQQRVYRDLDRLRIFGLPLYIALPWKETDDHALLLDIVIDGEPEYGRVHHPDRVRAAEAARGRAQTGGDVVDS
jgi:dihydropteroate synthase